MENSSKGARLSTSEWIRDKEEMVKSRGLTPVDAKEYLMNDAEIAEAKKVLQSIFKDMAVVRHYVSSLLREENAEEKVLTLQDTLKGYYTALVNTLLGRKESVPDETKRSAKSDQKTHLLSVSLMNILGEDKNDLDKIHEFGSDISMRPMDTSGDHIQLLQENFNLGFEYIDLFQKRVIYLLQAISAEEREKRKLGRLSKQVAVEVLTHMKTHE